MRSVHLVPLLPQIECVGGVVGAEPDLHFADHRDRSAAVDQRSHADGSIDFIADLIRGRELFHSDFRRSSIEHLRSSSEHQLVGQARALPH